MDKELDFALPSPLSTTRRARMRETLLGIWERERNTAPFVTRDIEEPVVRASRVVVTSGGQPCTNSSSAPPPGPTCRP